MRGRKPKPTHLKLVTGNPGGREINENEPVPSGAVIKPRFLTGRASKVWDEYAPGLIRVGLITAADRHAFAALCCLMAEFEAEPRDMVASRIAQMRALWAEFGMTPSARTRLQVPVPLPNTGASIGETYFDFD